MPYEGEGGEAGEEEDDVLGVSKNHKQLPH